MKKSFFGCITLLTLSALAFALQSPDRFLGFKLGSDRNLARYDRIKAYFQQLSLESPRVRIVTLGKTTLGNDLFMAVISAAENLQELEKYTSITRQLAQAEIDPPTAEKLAAAGKAIVFVTCNLHSTEIASSQMAMELAYRLANGASKEMLDILNDVILVLFPSVNPDGQIIEVDWYNKTRGSEYEGSGAPYLYHWYAGHDNNRDWFKVSLKETELIVRELYRKWFPQILVDEHQMGSSGDRLFVPPYQDPPTPGLHPLVWRAINLIGSRIGYDLEKQNLPGVASRGYFTGWWIGSLDDSAWFHNIPGILFEGASTRLASPIYVEPEEVESAESFKNEPRVFSPNPWKGGWWRLADLVNYDLQATLSVLHTAVRLRQELLFNTYQIARENIGRGESEAPYAFVVPRQQHDPATADRFIQVLLKSNIRVFQLTHPVRVGDTLFDKKSYVVPLAQPYRAFVKNIFERQHYPDIRKNLAAAPELPYDMAAWTLPLGMGVRSAAIDEPLKALMEPVLLERFQKNQFPEDLEEYIILDSRHNHSFRAAFELLAKGKSVYRNREHPDFSPGSFLVRKSEALDTLKAIHNDAPLQPASRKEISLQQFRRLRPFKTGLYQNWGHNMSEGWLRYVFDEYRVPYETVHPKDVIKKDFAGKYD
ncbi:MAG TPA: M14 metallopeptidase family protein, partial [Candidatus Binatia bacterium]|nr:M14 metallopeptidase family protein [Candidatus Binatia bacterium]